MSTASGPLADFYRRRLRKYAFVRVPKFAVFWTLWFVRWRILHAARWRIVRPVARAILPAGVLREFHRIRGMGFRAGLLQMRMPAIPLLSHAAAAQANLACEARQLFPAVRVECPRPELLPESLASIVPTLPTEYAFPPVCLSVVRDAEVLARSNMVVAGGAMVHHDLYRFTHDFTSEELHGRIRIYPGRAAVKRFAPRQAGQRFERAAAFTDACAPNYAHWLTEVLPRIHAYAQSRPGDAAVLIDAGLHRNLRASAELMLEPGMRLVELEANTVAHVERLDLVSPAGYIPFDRRRGPANGHGHGMFSSPVLRSMREHLARRVPAPAGDTSSRILLRRSSTGRALQNEQELEEHLLPLGFSSVYPERLSFAEQFRLFSAAEVVVGATGAALANLIFCPPDCRIVICLSAHPRHSFGYWQGMASAVGNKVAYVLGELRGSRAAGVHSDFSIDVRAVSRAVEAGATVLQ